MISILSDHDIEFYARLLWSQFSEGDWHSFGLGDFATFRDVGIAKNCSDRNIWLFCQRHNMLFLTANRNMDDASSLETAIRELNQADSLPVLTIARPKLLMNESYREDCAYRLADIMVDLAMLRGSGRQFIP
jgi:hypothetical protein